MRWRVRQQMAFRTLDGKVLPEGTVFEATQDEVKHLLHMLEYAPREEEPPRKRGRPPKRVQAFSSPPADRSM